MRSTQKAQALSRTVTADRGGQTRVRETAQGEIRRLNTQYEARLLVHLAPEELLWFRHNAVDKGRSMSDIIRELLREYRAKETAAGGASRG
jgi:hypothetical protein